MIRESIGTSANNDPDNYLLLGIAAAQGNLNLVDVLLNAGAEVNPKNSLVVEPLWYATTNGHLYIVRRLLNAGARIKSHSGRNMFLPAVVSGNAELVSVFLEHGAHPNEVIQGWAKPLMLAISLGHKEVADRLRDAGADRLDGLELTHKFAMQT